MHILRLTNSEDLNPAIPVEQQPHAVVERLLAEATGERWETTNRVIWPTPDLPDILDQWLDRYEPDIVFLRVSVYWYAFESVPRRLERRLGPAGRPLARLGLRAAATPAVNNRWLFRKARMVAQGTIGGDTPFTVEQVMETVEECARRVLRREDTGLLVRGGAGGTSQYPDLLPWHVRRLVRRRVHAHEALGALCDRLGVCYVGQVEAPADAVFSRVIGPDGLHRSAAGLAALVPDEVEALLRIFRDLRRTETQAPDPRR